MKKIYLLLLPFAIAATSHAQQNINFEAGGAGANYTWNVFENDTNPALEFVANPAPAGINTSATVAKYNTLITGMPWAGCETSHDNGMADFVLTPENCVIKVMVYKSVISNVGVKLVTPTGAALPEILVPNTLINEWEELTFNFASQIGHFAEPFGQIVIFPDFSPNPRTYASVNYFDNITFGTPEDMPETPMTPAPDPTFDASQVISMFSGVYTNVAVDTWQTEWSSGTLQDIEIQGNATKKYSNLNFVGVETVGPNSIDASEMTHFNVNVWSGDFTQFRIKLVDFGADNAYGGGDDVEHEVTYDSPQQGTWLTYSIPFSSFAGLITRENISQLIFSSNGTSTVYIDNVFFSQGEDNPVTEEPMTAAPDPTLPQAQVISMFSGVYTNVPVDTWKTDWSASGYQEIQIQGNATKKYPGLDFVGIETVGPNSIDASGMTHFNVDVWSHNFPVFKIKLVDFGADNAFGGGDDVEHEMVYESPAHGEWITYSIPLSEMTGLTTMSNISQLIFATADNTSIVYIDNVYFSTGTAGIEDMKAGKFVMYPNPASDLLNISAASAIEGITVYNMLGQQVLDLLPGSDSASINVSGLQKGIYTISTKINGTVNTQKFIKE